MPLRLAIVAVAVQLLSIIPSEAAIAFLDGQRWTSSSNFSTHELSDGHKCNDPFMVTLSEKASTKCPKACPYYVQNARAIETCSFLCVKAKDCEKWNPYTGIADDNLGICKAASISHCKEFQHGEDRCKTCQGGFHLTSEGKCFLNWSISVPVVGILVLLVSLILAWLIDMARRPITNERGLQQGLTFRLLSKLHQPKEAGHARHIWPLTTNLCKQLVAGPGLCLHFNFQAVIIIWAFCVAIGWCFMGATIDSDLFVLGTKKFGTPRVNCQLVAWGYSTQQRLMWTKVYFTYWVYLLSFVGCLLHSIRQLRNFQTEEMETKTMGDFSAFIEGLPEQKGTIFAEENVKAAIEKATDQRVVGVSIAWDYQKDAELVEDTLARQVREKEPIITSPRSIERAEEEPKERSQFREKLEAFELSLFHDDISAKEGTDPTAEITEALKNMTSSSNAVVVFETEHMRDTAVELSSKQGGIPFEGAQLTLENLECEADTIYWRNFGNTTFWLQVWRIVKGVGYIFLALTMWTMVFYLPYAYSVYTFNYDNGQQPGIVYSLAFTIVVVIGNAIMYEVCSRIADSVQFKFKDPRESLYMILYTIACTLNILLDFVLTFVITYKVAKGLDFRTYYGVPIEHVDQEGRFEVYAMQRLLGQNAFMYAFPSTYLVPFLIEPFATIWLPYKLGQIIVRCHPEIQGQEAEDYLACIPMDMGRYADIILNIILGVVILFFPGGYNHTLFFALAFSHIWIYLFDHVKVLRGIKACDFASMEVDWWSQVMLIPCCGTLLACLVFKANTGEYGYYLQGNWLFVACCAAFFGHFAVHLALLTYVVPLFGQKHEEFSDLANMTYADLNQQEPDSWFSTNPIHCLRSQFIYKQEPPCGFYFLGKEYLLQVNENIGCFYEPETSQTPPNSDDNMDLEQMKEHFTRFSARFTTLRAS